jgi:hypothetical protein
LTECGKLHLLFSGKYKANSSVRVNWFASRQTDRQMDGQTNELADRFTDRLTDAWVCRRDEWKRDGQTE